MQTQGGYISRLDEDEDIDELIEMDLEANLKLEHTEASQLANLINLKSRLARKEITNFSQDETKLMRVEMILEKLKFIDVCVYHYLADFF